MRTFLCLLLLLQTTTIHAQGIRRVAVLDFENAGPDRSLDWVGVGLAESMSQALKKVPSLMLVNRSSLDDVMNEFRLAKSKVMNPATVVQMGKVLGAQSLVVGNYQVVNGTASLGARIVDVETSVEMISASVSGPFKNILKLQDDLARQLIGQIHGDALMPASSRYPNLDAFRAFSSGAYALRTNNAKEALAQFDRALAIDHDYSDAQFYRGLALKKLNRTDDAIAAFKKVLPYTKAPRRVTWSWEPSFAADAKPGLIMGLDQNRVRFGWDHAQKSVLFHERKGDATRFYASMWIIIEWSSSNCRTRSRRETSRWPTIV